jgi:hypothetical protein
MATPAFRPGLRSQQGARVLVLGIGEECLVSPSSTTSPWRMT